MPTLFVIFAPLYPPVNALSWGMTSEGRGDLFFRKMDFRVSAELP